MEMGGTLQIRVGKPKYPLGNGAGALGARLGLYRVIPGERIVANG